jgi:hypothetical protein
VKVNLIDYINILYADGVPESGVMTQEKRDKQALNAKSQKQKCLNMVKKGISLAAIARQTGVAAPTISAWRNKHDKL